MSDIDDEVFHVCSTREPMHVDNCPKCFGFGVITAGLTQEYPVHAGDPRIGSDMVDAISHGYRQCGVCGGTVNGAVTTTTRAGDVILMPDPWG